MEGAYCGFQPKPAVEVIIVAMKRVDQKSFTGQAMTNGKGVTWLDDCRIPIIGADGKAAQGRLTANLLISDNILDYGNITKGGGFPGQRGKTEYSGLNQKRSDRVGQINDQGGYSRYFSLDVWAKNTLPFLISKKASQREKEAGLEGFEEKQIMGRDFGQDIRNNPYKIRPVKRRNVHPTVKPIKLMAYLITMGSREGDVVLDPFCGSGTTIIAASMLNRKSIGIEKDDYYWQIAEARIRYWMKQTRMN
jgi:site-specific DNA-methyltransferase (adenine-specific)